MFDRKIPVKNYIILLILFVVTFLLGWYLISLYNNIQKYKKDNSDVLDVINEISEVEWDNYLVENPNILVYIMNGQGNNIEFEKEFREYIIDSNISNSTVYINEENVSSHFVQYLNNFALENVSIGMVPNVLVIEKGHIVDVLYNGWNIWNNDEAMQFVREYYND